MPGTAGPASGVCSACGEPVGGDGQFLRGLRN